MALDPKKAEEYRKEVEATAKSTQDIKNDLRDILFSTRDYAQESREAAKAVFEGSIQAGSTAKAFRELTETTRDIRREFEDIVGGTKTMSDISKDLQKLETRRKNLLVEQEQAVSAIFTEYQFGVEAQNAINQAMGSTAGLQDVLLAYGQDLTEEQQNLLNLYIEQGLALQEQDDNLEEVAKRAKTIDSAMRPLGDKAIGLQDAAEGLSKGLSKAGLGNLGDKLGIDSALKGTREMASSITKGGTEALGMSGKMKLAGNFAKTLGSNLTKSLGPAALIAMAIEQIVEAFKLIDGLSGDVAKNMGVSAKEGRALVASSNQAATASGDLLVSTEDVVKAQMSLNKEFGTSVQFAGEFAAEFASIQERTKLSGEAMGFFAAEAQVAGGNIKDQLNEVADVTQELNYQNGLVLNQKDIQEGIAKTSKASLLSAGRNTKEIANQVFQTKLLGASQQQLESAQMKLLDFEQSIAAELEAELLTGKDLNLERAREAALMNDQATLAKELKEQMGSSEEFTSRNVIQQEAMANAMGMTREEMAEMLINQENLEAIQRAFGDDIKNMSEAQVEYNKLRESGLSVEEAALAIGDKQLANQLESATMADKFAAAQDKLKDLFVALVEPLMPVLDILTQILNDVLNPIMKILSPILKAIGDLLTGIISPILNTLFEPIQMGADLLNEILSIFQEILPEGTELGSIFGTIGKILGTIVSATILPFQAGIRFIIERVRSLKDIFSGIVDLFTGDFESGFKKIGKGLIGFIMAPFQVLYDIVTGMINKIIEGVNYIPGVNIPTIPDFDIAGSIVGLKDGGIVPATPGGVPALIGEGGEDEVVMPLSKLEQFTQKYKDGVDRINPFKRNSSESEEIKILNKKMDELISAVKAGGDVYMDSTKIGTAMSVGTYKVQ